MTRITSVDNLLFPVELRPVYTDIEVDGNKEKIEVPNNRIVVNNTSGRPLGVVSKNYKLITNKQAIELGERCCKELFGADEATNIEIFNVDAPSTASYCHIDLVHKNYVMNLWDEENRSETYIPYVRLTNSYNTSRALRFDVGFCRKLCLNGMIFESETIKFTFSHLKHELTDDISFAIEGGKIEGLFEKFTSYVDKLKNHEISKDDSLKMIHALLQIKDVSEIDFSDTREDKEEYQSMLNELEGKLDGYIVELGTNSYALFNAITDIASHPMNNKYLRRDMNSMQRLAGNWINSYQKLVEDAGFSVDTYIQLLKESPGKALHLSENRYESGNG